jgi:mono/diheme cytochrome c family protein
MVVGVGVGVVAASALLAACDDDPTVPNLEYMPDMVSSVAYDSFAPNPNTRDGRTLLAPPPGTVPRGYQPFHFAPGPAEAARAGRELTNPLPDVPLVRQRGEIAFQRWCSPCHGHEGQADGLVTRKFPRPPSLTAEHARTLPDGQLFHIVTFGQGVMPAYGAQVMDVDRWKIVRFVRRMQADARPALPSAGPGNPPAPALAPVPVVPGPAPALAPVPAAAVAAPASSLTVPTSPPGPPAVAPPAGDSKP